MATHAKNGIEGLEATEICLVLPSGPFWAVDGKKRIDGTEILVVLPLGIIRIVEKIACPRVGVHEAGVTKVPFRCNSLRRSMRLTFQPSGPAWKTLPGVTRTKKLNLRLELS